MDKLLKEIEKAPFVRLVIPLILGIALSNYFSLNFSGLYIIIPSFVLLCVLFNNRNYNLRWVWGFVLYVNLFFIGFYLIEQEQKITSIPTDNAYIFKLRPVDNPIKKTKTYRSTCKIEGYYNNGKWNSCNEKAFVYFKNTENVPKAGDVFWCNIKFSEIPPPSNPYEFNYKAYMARKAFFVTAFINSDIVYGNDKGLPFYLKYPLQMQSAAKNVFKKAGIKEREFAVISALIVGDKSYIDQDLHTAFSTSGVVHLLAISGLHVGIIYAVLNFLLSFVNTIHRGKYFKAVIIIFVLWFYAGIAGFSPSVVRACFMFSVFALGNLFSLNRNTYNSIAFSAFVICIIKPYSVFDLSFLLSYSAVIGIVFFQRRIFNLWSPKSRLLKSVWSLSTITLAAQLATAPIIFYYFNKFPNYFLLSNLIVLPLATLAMYLAVSLLFISFFPWLLKIFGAILQFILSLINDTVFYFESLPSALTDGIYLNTYQYILLSLTVIFIGLFCFIRKARLIQLSLVCLILFFTIKLFREKQWAQQYQLGMYNIKGVSYYYHFNAREGYKILNDTSVNYNYNTKQHLIRKGFVDETALKNIHLENLPNFYRGVVQFKGKYIGVASKLEVQYNRTKKFNLHYLLADIPLKKAEAILLNYTPDSIIIAGSLSAYEAKKWEEFTKQVY